MLCLVGQLSLGMFFATFCYENKNQDKNNHEGVTRKMQEKNRSIT